MYRKAGGDLPSAGRGQEIKGLVTDPAAQDHRGLFGISHAIIKKASQKQLR
jgi:hypothetical protein